MLPHLKRDQANTTQEAGNSVLQGVIDQMLEQQKANNEHMRMAREAMLAPKEIVRGADGKATGVRTTAN